MINAVWLSEKQNMKRKGNIRVIQSKGTQADERGCQGDVSIHHLENKIKTNNEDGCVVAGCISAHGV